MKPEIRHGDYSYNWNDVKKQCSNNFLRRAMDKFRDTGSLKRKEGSGRNELSLAKAKKNKETWYE